MEIVGADMLETGSLSLYKTRWKMLCPFLNIQQLITEPQHVEIEPGKDL